MARSPIVLALIPPRIPPVDALPDVGEVRASPPSAHGAPTLEGVTREALRVRVRWVHELSARAAAELAPASPGAGVLPDAEAIRYLRWDELEVLPAHGSRSTPTVGPTDAPHASCRRSLPPRR